MAPGEAAKPRVLLCASGSVAGIKVAELAALLEAAGVDVRVVVTRHGATFVALPQNGAPLRARVYSDDDDGRALLEVRPAARGVCARSRFCHAPALCAPPHACKRSQQAVDTAALLAGIRA